MPVFGPYTLATATALGGHLVRLGLGIVASVILARTLAPSGYGLVASIGVVLAIAQTIADAGLRHTIVRELARTGETTEQRALARAAMSLALLLGAAGAIAGILAAEPIALHLVGRPDAVTPLRIALAGLLPASLGRVVAAMLQAGSQFRAIVTLQAATGVANAGVMVLLAATGALTVESAVLVGAVNPLIGALVVWRRVPHGWLSPLIAEARERCASLLRYGRWLWVSSVLSLLSSQLDLLLVSRWLAEHETGLYALAFNVALRLDILNQSRFSVRLPAVSRLATRAQIAEYVRTSLTRGLAAAVVLAAVAWTGAPFFVRSLYGPEYAPAVAALNVLVLAVALDLVMTPLTMLAFTFDAPRVLALADATRVGVLWIVAAALVPVLGIAGAAVAKVTAKAAGIALTLVLLWRRYRKSDQRLGVPVTSITPADVAQC